MKKCFGDFNQALEDTDKRNCFDCLEQKACLREWRGETFLRTKNKTEKVVFT